MFKNRLASMLRVGIFIFSFLAAPFTTIAEEMKCDNSFYTLACFDPYSSNLSESHKVQINKIIEEIISQNNSMSPIDHITVIGHSARFGNNPRHAEALDRARSTEKYIRQLLNERQLNGIDIEVTEVGDAEPRTTNSSSTGRDLNRRVEIFLRTNVLRHRVQDLKKRCKEADMKSYVDRWYKSSTCHANSDADKYCIDFQSEAAVEGGELIGGACLPAEIRCVICWR